MTDAKRLPDIFTYFDFRKYLADYYRRRKEYDPGFSHTYICHRLGQRNSKSYFANVIRGVKNMTAEFINRTIELLELSAEEAKYFRALVNYNQSCNPSIISTSLFSATLPRSVLFPGRSMHSTRSGTTASSGPFWISMISRTITKPWRV